VVIHGASAGAGSVALHLTAQYALLLSILRNILLTVCSGGRNEGLFVGAIGESVFFPTQPQVSELEWQFERYVNETNCAGTADELECLRSQDITVLQAANVPSPYPGRTSSPRFYWTPTIDGDFIQDYPYVLLEQGKIIKVPIIFGGSSTLNSPFVLS
jgi:acetylcholinesterase